MVMGREARGGLRKQEQYNKDEDLDQNEDDDDMKNEEKTPPGEEQYK